MDAVKFIKAYRRMCNAYDSCLGCPMEDYHCELPDIYKVSEIEHLVSQVDLWNEAHPLHTNGDKVLEQLDCIDGNNSISRGRDRVLVTFETDWWDAEWKEKEYE